MSVLFFGFNFISFEDKVLISGVRVLELGCGSILVGMFYLLEENYVWNNISIWR